MKKKTVIILSGLAVLSAAGYFVWKINNDSDENKTASVIQDEAKPETVTPVQTNQENENTNKTEPEPAPPAPSAWPVVYSNSEAASLTVVVNKKHKLPSSYTPSLVSVSGGQLRQEAADALQSLFSGATAMGNSLDVISSFRSYSNQESTYAGWVSQYGQAQADTFSARAGHSEHQTGLAVDVGLANDSSYDLEQSFGQTSAGQWLASHAQEYGFIIRYPEGKDAITGYHYEPWHLRFVGLDTAKAIYSSGKTMDEYFNIPAGGYE